MISFVYRNMVLGGIHTLVYRMSVALSKRACQIDLFCNSIDKSIEQLYKQHQISINVFNGLLPCEINVDGYDPIIVFEFELYWRLSKYLHKRKSDRKLILYSVHPYTIDYYISGPTLKKNLFQKIFYSSYSKYIRNSVINHHIAFMDEQCFKQVNNSYKIGVKENEMHDYIVHLIFESQYDKSPHSFEHHKTILSVSRADFPFKGYLKGLIEQFVDLKKIYEDISLVLISSGSQFDILKEWVNNCCDSSNISLIENVPYPELMLYYKNADFYVGMGTTIIEAASCGTIAIPIAPYTFECNTNGVFISNPEWLLTELNEGSPVINIFDDLLKMDKTQLIAMSEESIQAVKKIYSEEIVIDQLFSFIDKCSNDTLIEGFPWLFLALKRFKAFFREKHKYSRKNNEQSNKWN